MRDAQQILDLAVCAGEILLKNGAEIFRVQETIEHILDAYGLQKRDVYVIANGIFATVDAEDARAVTVRDVPLGEVHLGRIAAVNELSRHIANRKGETDPADMARQLEKCAALPRKPAWLEVLATAVGAAGFCFLLGGLAADCFPAFVAGAVLGLFQLPFRRYSASPYVYTIAGAALVTLLCVIFFRLGFGRGLDKMIAGAIIPLVPGIPLTTSIRDFFRGDYLSGSIRLFNALLKAGCIAVGVVVALQLAALLGLGGVL